MQDGDSPSFEFLYQGRIMQR